MLAHRLEGAGDNRYASKLGIGHQLLIQSNRL
jgi:hypothetical protein